MHVYVLVREDQNEHGYIDTSITGVFSAEETATAQEEIERVRAQAEGLIVEDDNSDGEWQVSWRVEEHVLR